MIDSDALPDRELFVHMKSRCLDDEDVTRCDGTRMKIK